MKNKRVDVEDVQRNAEERQAFNFPELNEIDFYYDNKKVDIPKDEVDEFVFTGLSNADFVLTRDWDA